jgi:hypothetical protein
VRDCATPIPISDRRDQISDSGLITAGANINSPQDLKSEIWNLQPRIKKFRCNEAIVSGSAGEGKVVLERVTAVLAEAEVEPGDVGPRLSAGHVLVGRGLGSPADDDFDTPTSRARNIQSVHQSSPNG